MNTDEIALRIAKNVFNTETHRAWSYEGGDEEIKEFAHALLAELSKDVGPTYQFRPDCENWIDCTKVFYDRWGGEKRTLLTQPLPTADIEQRTAEAIAHWIRCGDHHGVITSDDVLAGKWKEYL